MNHRFLIGAASSGSGKTTITMGLLRALASRGLRVQPFKCGPDYIDTLFHRQASGRESVNLDTFMASDGHVREIYRRYGADADVCVAEGVMGLFDGYERARGSSAEVAALLGLPVILVVNAQSAAYSVAPVILGFRKMLEESGGRLAGVVFNRVASEGHYRFLREAGEDVGVPSLGYVSRNAALAMPSRHLGLTVSAREDMERFIRLAADEVEAHVDIPRLLELCVAQPCAEAWQPAESLPADDLPAEKTPSPRRRLAIARDEAFNFVYRANIDALARVADITFFSPLRDETLPPCDALYLPGGYPELFADALSANRPMRSRIKAFADGGGRVLAECGGFMYLCRGIDGREMCGVFPFEATMEGAHLHLGYRKALLGGISLRGHEFHYSTVADEPLPEGIIRETTQRTATGRPVLTAIYRHKNVIAGYTHWYWAEHGTDGLLDL